jgi:hypothetical protein
MSDRRTCGEVRERRPASAVASAPVGLSGAAGNGPKPVSRTVVICPAYRCERSGRA